MNTVLAHRAMEPGHLLHLALTCPPSGNVRHLKSRHPFVLAAQQLVSSSDNKIRSAALWTDHQWNAELLDNTMRLRTFILTPAPTFLEWRFREQRGFGLTASTPVSDAHACINGV